MERVHCFFNVLTTSFVCFATPPMDIDAKTLITFSPHSLHSASHEDYTCYGSHRATHVPSTRESRRTAGRFILLE